MPLRKSNNPIGFRQPEFIFTLHAATSGIYLYAVKRFFTTQIDDKHAVLTGSERDHCVRVLRSQVGDEVEVVNGCGDLLHCRLESIGKEASLIIMNKMHHEPHVFPDLAIAIPKSPSRWEFLLEKSTEIGVGRIYPLITKRSEKKHIREERSGQIIQSAFKQSLHHYIPKLHSPIALESLISLAEVEYHQAYIAHCASKETPYLGNLYQPREKSLILVGPEGDFTSEEISLTLKQGFTAVSLGSSRLRVETAGITVCNIIQCIESTSS